MIDNAKFPKRLLIIYLIVFVVVFQQGVNFQMMMFMYYPPKHLCQYPNISGVTVSVDNCQYYIKQTDKMTTHQCTSWHFDQSQITTTFVTELSLVCQYRYLQLLLVPLCQLFSIFNLILAILSDIKGRRILFLLALFLDAFFWALLGIVSTNYIVHVIIRCLKSAVAAAAIIGFVLISEITPTRYRNIVIINYWIPFSMGAAFAPVYVWSTYNWKTAWLLSMIPNLVYCAAPFFIVESPQWLITKNRRNESDQISEKLSLENFSDETQSIIVEKESVEDIQFSTELKSILHSFTMVTRIFVLLFTSFIFYFVYQGISTNLQFASTNIYINAAILGLVEVPSGPISSLCSKYFGSVHTTCFGLFLIIVFYLIYNGLSVSLAVTNVIGNVSKLVLACLIRSLLSGTWNIQCIFYVTLFPTMVRNFFSNTGETVSKCGAALGGFIGYYIATKYITEGFTYGISLLVAMLLIAFIIPSSKDEPLPRTVTEAKNIKKELCCNKSVDT